MSISHLGVAFKEITRLDITDYKKFSPKTHYRLKSWNDDRVTVDRFFELDALLKRNKSRRLEHIIKFHSREFNRFKSEFPFRSGLNSFRWVRQLFRYSIINRITWLWIIGKNA